MEDKKDSHITDEKDIDLLELTNKLWKEKKFLFKIIGIGTLIGLIVAFSIPKEYTTTVVLMPEGQSAIGNVNTLAAMAGINISNTAGMDALALPDLYPDVVNSTPFLKGLFNIKVHDVKQEIDTTLYVYMLDFNKIAWWSYVGKSYGALRKLLLSSSDGDDSVQINHRLLTEEEFGVIKNLRERISVYTDKKTAVTTIEVKMQSPEISAFLADTITAYLQEYVIDYRTQKARSDLRHAEKLYEEAKENYYRAQKELAMFIDGNINVVSAKYKTTQDRLQNEANLSYSVYNQMAQQLQMVKIRVQDTTPFITIIQPAVQPLEPSKPSKKLILIGFIFLAFVGGSAWVLRKEMKELL